MKIEIQWTEDLKRNLARTYIDALAKKCATRYDQDIYAELDENQTTIKGFDYIASIHSRGKIVVDTIREDNFGEGWDRGENGEILDTEENIDAMADCLNNWNTLFKIEDSIKEYCQE